MSSVWGGVKETTHLPRNYNIRTKLLNRQRTVRVRVVSVNPARAKEVFEKAGRAKKRCESSQIENGTMENSQERCLRDYERTMLGFGAVHFPPHFLAH